MNSHSQSPRTKSIIRASIISIIANFALAGFKAVVGLFANSTAIISDSIHNLSDALSGFITIIGAKIHSRKSINAEYVAAIIIAIIVLQAGVMVLIESIKKIINPEPVDYTTTTLIILIAGVIVKFALGIYVKNQGRQVKSDALVASGTESFNDAILSISVLASTIIYMIFHLNIEAYVGALLSVYILYTGIMLIKDSRQNR